ncbi:MAG TPA: FCD domain-containing protein [Actinomycetota bacterium]|jgi:GntR family transcriptional repressor for pyruvate dehydrogenase complex|nr:FCD domain-containing protein [Actinomycetota bacterium]
MVQALRNQRLSRGVVDGLLAAVRAGEFAPGDRLPSERRLAEAFGVSRPSIREGLRILELIGAVEVRQGRGAIVLEDATEPSGTLLRGWLRSHQDEVLDLLDVREVLEAAAAASAASRSRAEAEPITAVADDEDLEARVKADVAFHGLIADRSGNAILAGLIHELNGVLETSRFAMFAMPGRPERSLEDHRRIAKAVNSGDPVGAARAMRRHIERTRKEIEMLDAKGTG